MELIEGDSQSLANSATCVTRNRDPNLPFSPCSPRSCTQLRGYLADRIARAKIRRRTEKVHPSPSSQPFRRRCPLNPIRFLNAKTKTLTNNQRFPLVSCSLSHTAWMDYMVLVMVMLAFRATDVQSPVATALAMPLANSCRIAGKLSSRYFVEEE